MSKFSLLGFQLPLSSAELPWCADMPPPQFKRFDRLRGNPSCIRGLNSRYYSRR